MIEHLPEKEELFIVYIGAYSIHLLNTMDTKKPACHKYPNLGAWGIMVLWYTKIMYQRYNSAKK